MEGLFARSRILAASRLQTDATDRLCIPGEYRRTWTLPLVFFADRTSMCCTSGSTRFLFRTADGGTRGRSISPDLTREDPGVPANLDAGRTAAGTLPKGNGAG